MNKLLPILLNLVPWLTLTGCPKESKPAPPCDPVDLPGGHRCYTQEDFQKLLEGRKKAEKK